MKYDSFLLLAASLSFVACGEKKQDTNTGQKDTAQVKAELVSETAPSDSVELEKVKIIEGMESCELPKVGVKAGIIDGRVQWDVTDVAKFKKVASVWDEFYRIGDGPFAIECPNQEEPIGVFLADRDNHRDINLFVITAQHHVVALDITREVSMLGFGAGMIPGLEDVVNLKQEGKSVYAINSKGEQTLVKMYNDGPYELSVSLDEIDFGITLSSTWNMRFTRYSGETYIGTFRNTGKGKYAFVLDARNTYDEETGVAGQEEMTPIEGTFRLDDAKETITLDKEIQGFPKGKVVSYDVVPLYD